MVKITKKDVECINAPHPDGDISITLNNNVAKWGIYLNDVIEYNKSLYKVTGIVFINSYSDKLFLQQCD